VNDDRQPDAAPASIVTANRPSEWALALTIVLAAGFAMMEYHRLWRGKGYSWLVANECAAIAGTVGIALALALGRLRSVRLLRLRRPLGISAVLAVTVHGLVSLFVLPQYDWAYFVSHWLPMLLGIAALAGLAALVALSYPWALRRMAPALWKRWQACSYILLAAALTHFVLLDKFDAWLNWFRTHDPPAPPGTLIPFAFGVLALGLKLSHVVVTHTAKVPAKAPASE
jgi:hypothetical protein